MTHRIPRSVVRIVSALHLLGYSRSRWANSWRLRLRLIESRVRVERIVQSEGPERTERIGQTGFVHHRLHHGIGSARGQILVGRYDGIVDLWSSQQTAVGWAGAERWHRNKQ